MKKPILLALAFMTSGCVVPAYAPPPNAPGMAYEYYPDYNYYYGAPYPAYYGGAVGFYDWGYWGHDDDHWHGGHWEGGHWGDHFHRRWR